MALRYQYLTLLLFVLAIIIGALTFLQPPVISISFPHGDPLGTSAPEGLSVPPHMQVR